MQPTKTKHLSSEAAEGWTLLMHINRMYFFNAESVIWSGLTELRTWTHHHTACLRHDLRAALRPPEPALALPLLCLRPVHHAGGHKRHPGGSAGLRHFSSHRERHHRRRPSPLTDSGSLFRGLLRGQQETPAPRG